MAFWKHWIRGITLPIHYTVNSSNSESKAWMCVPRRIQRHACFYTLQVAVARTCDQTLDVRNPFGVCVVVVVEGGGVVFGRFSKHMWVLMNSRHWGVGGGFPASTLRSVACSPQIKQCAGRPCPTVSSWRWVVFISSVVFVRHRVMPPSPFVVQKVSAASEPQGGGFSPCLKPVSPVTGGWGPRPL